MNTFTGNSTKLLHLNSISVGKYKFGTLKWKCFTFDILKYSKIVTLWTHGLIVRALDSQSRGTGFRTTGWTQG